MRLSARFLAQTRQYAALEEQLGKDYSLMLQSIGWNEAQRLADAGVPRDEAFEMVNSALTQNVKRFPVQVSDIPF